LPPTAADILQGNPCSYLFRAGETWFEENDPEGGANRRQAVLTRLQLQPRLLIRYAVKLDAALASNASVFDSDHLTPHKR